MYIDNRLIIARMIVGSKAQNLDTPESDSDYKYFVCPTFDDLYDKVEYSNTNISADVDYEIHDIRKLGELLWKANLSYIICLFGKDLYYRPEASWIFNNAEGLARMNLPCFYNATTGMHREKMVKIFSGTSTTRELVDKYGYDTKQACHALRCLYVLDRVSSGMSMGSALFFGEGTQRTTLMSLKNGEKSYAEFITLVQDFKNDKLPSIEAWFKFQKPNFDLAYSLNLEIKRIVELNYNGELIQELNDC